MTSNQINYWHNKEVERANRENEKIKAREADIKAQEASTKSKEAMTNLAKAKESERHNLVEEALEQEKFEENQRQFVGNFILNWGRNLAGAVGSLLS